MLPVLRTSALWDFNLAVESASGLPRTSSLGAARPLPSSADICREREPQRRPLAGYSSGPAPALGERRHRLLARGGIAVGGALHVPAVARCPHPGTALR